MDLEDKFIARVSGIQSLSSSVPSTPEKNDNSDDASKTTDLPQEFILKPGPKKEFLRICLDKQKKNSASSKGKMTESLKTTTNKFAKKDSKKTAKQNRKGENPMRVPLCPEQSPDSECLNSSWIFKKSACRAVLCENMSVITLSTSCPWTILFARCLCCICHLFYDNKDPSLWLVCSSESGEPDFCGLSCHIECALQRENVGVVDLGQLMQLDASYCCASCAKVSGILGIPNLVELICIFTPKGRKRMLEIRCVGF